MNIRLGRTTRPPPARVRRVQRDEETAALSYVSVDEFARLVACGRATPEHARSCIYNLVTRLGDQNLPQRREEYAAYHAGGRLLSWLLLQDLAVRDELSQDSSFVDAVTLFLVAEAREDIVWKWLKLEPYPSFDEEKARHTWIAGLIKAQRKWHTSVVPALSTIRKAAEEFNTDMLISATVVGTRIVQDQSLAPYDPALFDALAEAIHAIGPSIKADNRCARPLLFHPVDPSADLLLQIQRDQVDPGLWSAPPASVNAFGSHALRAAYILHLQNRADDASFLETLVRNRIPAVWRSWGKVRAECEGDPKLNELRRDCLALRDPRKYSHQTPADVIRYL